MRLTVAIPTLGSRAELEDLFAALARQDFPADEREVVVIGNLECTSLRALVCRWQERIPNLQLTFTGKLGVNAARNRALTIARGEIAVFFDDDCVPDGTNFLSEVSRLHSLHPEAWAIGGFYRTSPDAGRFAKTYVEISRYSLLSLSYAGEQGFLRALNLLGGNVSYKRARLGAGFRFDPTIVFGGAETDFHARLVAAGAELVLVDSLVVEHRVRLGAAAFLRRAYVQGRAWALLQAKGTAPRLSLHPTLAPPPSSWEASAFRFTFQLGVELLRIDLYEFGKYRRFAELAKLRWRAFAGKLRGTLLLRELCYSWLALRGGPDDGRGGHA